jgi:AbrB family looped-hinge helix DNA binding protein
MTTVTMSSKGWVVIPSELRKKYKLGPGTPISFVDYGGVLSLLPALTDPVEQSHGKLKGRRSLTKALLAERRLERRRER